MGKRKRWLIVLLALVWGSVAPVFTGFGAAAAETVTEVAAPVSQPLSEVRASPQGQVYTVSGKIISPVNGWGGQGFYIQDGSGAGLYIYPRTAMGYETGDVVQLTGNLGNYNGELQLTAISQQQKLDQALDTPVRALDLSSPDPALQGTLVSLSNVTVGAIETDQYQNALFSVTDSAGRELAVRLDSRTGVRHSQVLAKIAQGDRINLTGILSVYKDSLQLKPFSLDQLELVERAADGEKQPTASYKIGSIQGSSHTSPLVGQTVQITDAVVTYADSRNRFYIQDLSPDADKATSDGLTVYQANANVAVGDVLRLTGTVEEYFGSGYDDRKETDLSITQLRAQSIEKTGRAPVPEPLILGTDSLAPSPVIDNDSLSLFDPEEDALDYWESLEGMLVAIDQAKIIGPLKNREIYVLPAGAGQELNQLGGPNLTPAGPSTALIPLLLKTGKQTVKAGDTLAGRVAGPVSYSYSNYKVLVDDASLPPIQDGGLLPEQTALAGTANQLTIASYNVENFSANSQSTSPEKVTRLAQSFVSDLKSPDIIGLIEVQDNNGAIDDGTTDASQSAQRLIDAIRTQGGPVYTYVDIAPENNQDGGQPGANIRVGFLYNPERVALSDKPKADATEAVSWQGGELSHSLGRIDPTNPNWASTRKSLAAEFVFRGQKLVLVANHLNSKRGDSGYYGRQQPPKRDSESQRHALASLLHQFAQEGLAQNPDTRLVMLGDFNDYEFSQTSRLIEGDSLSNLVSRHDAADRFSYFYQGSYQSLDNIFISNNLLSAYTFDMVHINAPFMEAHGRASDHDPLLLQLSLGGTDLAQSDSSETSQSAAQTSGQNQAGSAAAVQAAGEGASASSAGSAGQTGSPQSRKILPKTGQEPGDSLTGLGLLLGLLSLGLWRLKQADRTITGIG